MTRQSVIASRSSDPGKSTGQCSWARHFTVPLSTRVYKWVLANVTLGVISIPPVEELLYATETMISASLMDHLVHKQTSTVRAVMKF